MARSLHVLLVEDDELIALNTRRALRRSAEVVAVTLRIDGRDALDWLLGVELDPARPLVIVTDLDMPRLCGIELLKALRGEPRLCRLPVLVLTSSPRESDRQAALALDVAGYFVKSSSDAALEGILSWLRGFQPGTVACAPAR